MNIIPSFETERLILRPHVESDLPGEISMWADPLITRYTIGEPSAPQRSWLRIMAYLGRWQLKTYGYFAIEEKSSGKFIGEMGFADFKREIILPSELAGLPESGWALSSEEQGKG